MTELWKNDQETQQLIKAVDTLADNFNRFEITTASDYEVAANYLKTVKERLKALEEKRKEATVPLDTAKKTVMSWFKPAIEKGEGIVVRLNTAMSEYRRKLEAEAAKKQAEINAQAKADDIFVPQVEVNVSKPEGLKVRKNWKYRIKDVSKINGQFMVPDEKKIGELVRAMKEKAVDIVGKDSIEVYCEETAF